MKSDKKQNRIIWAVDIFNDIPALRDQVIKSVQKLAGKADVSLQPVYVLSPDRLNFAYNISADWLKVFRSEAQKKLINLTRSRNKIKMEDPHIVVHQEFSVSKSAQALDQYATEAGASLIVTTTHARKGITRLFLGSFAESLLLRSHTPVMVINPHVKLATKFDRIFFPTDFSESSKLAFKKAALLAQSSGAKIILFHGIAFPSYTVVQSGVMALGGGLIGPFEIATDLEQPRRQEAENFVKSALTEMAIQPDEIRLEIIIRTCPEGITQAAVNLAKRKGANLIVLAAESGQVSSAVFGSVTRQVVRASSCPVIVVRSHESAKLVEAAASKDEMSEDFLSHPPII